MTQTHPILPHKTPSPANLPTPTGPLSRSCCPVTITHYDYEGNAAEYAYEKALRG